MKEISNLLKNAEISEEEAEEAVGGIIRRISLYNDAQKEQIPVKTASSNDGYITNVKIGSGTRNA